MIVRAVKVEEGCKGLGEREGGKAASQGLALTVGGLSLLRITYVQVISSSSFGKVKVGSSNSRSGALIGQKFGPSKLIGSKRPCSSQGPPCGSCF